MSDNSDYNKPRTNLYDLLPDVYRSDTNQAVFENLFNRFLTKQETNKIAGYIGKGNTDAIFKRQIKEPTVHRQGYQLQPILHNKIGSVEWMSSWYDLLNEAERLGIDRDRMQEWLNLLQFNWVPPVDIDKIVHYNDYYWYDEENPNSRPQYITIRSRCSTARALVNFQQDLVTEFGETIPTVNALAVDGTIPQFTIADIYSSTNQIVVVGDAQAELVFDQFFEIQGTSSNDGVYTVAGALSYDAISNRTIIPVTSGSLVSDETAVGVVHLRRYDKLVIAGEYLRLFNPGFVFFYRNSSNSELDSSFWTVVDSTYNSTTNQTTIKIDTVFTNDVVDGVISQTEKLASALAARDCQCTGSVGWDILQWDDNPSDPLWNGDHQTLVAAITHTSPPTTPGTSGDLWWDTTSDYLFQYGDTTGWKPLWGHFSAILSDTTGQALWDLTPGCGVSSIISAADQWVQQNKWLHKSDVPTFSIAKQAKLPIIEYDWDLELNEWTYTPYIWKYRSDNYSTWTSTDAQPELIELIPLDLWEQNGEEIVLDEKYGDLTEYFVPGRQFMSIGGSVILEVEYSQFKSTNPSEPRRTVIKMTTAFATSGLVGGSLTLSGSPAAPTASITPLRPVKTSQDEPWKGYGIHWLFVGEGSTLPVVHQPENDLTAIAPGTLSASHPSGNYDYTYTYYAQEVTIQATGVADIELTGVVLPDTNVSLRQRALLGANDVRVYIDGIRQYGTYEEIDNDGNGFVTDISFLPGFSLELFADVRIEVGEASSKDYGRSFVPVRTIEDNIAYAAAGNQTVSLVRYRKAEQVKSEVNQYPLFDIYNVDGSPAYKANHIFGFQTDSTAAVNTHVGQRLATDTSDTDYMFQQLVVDADGTMYAFRDYVNQINNFWVNPSTQQVFFWDGLAWSDKTQVGSYYMSAIVSDSQPEAPWDTIDGLYWYDTLEQQLKRKNISSSTWEIIDAVFVTDDNTLETIWQKGLNNELYIPEKRDWNTRSLSEYNSEKDLYVEQRAEELVNTGLSTTAATSQAESEWFSNQSNHLSTSGAWVGDWEIPDPLYYNVSHENRQTVSFREVLTHFNSIIQAQPKIPAFNGPSESMFHLIPTNEVNYGLGGTIKEFNYGFDTFLSSLFINMVSPRALYDFAHEQYDALLNNLKELLRKNAVDMFIDTSTNSLADQSSFITQTIIDAHEQNDNYALLYGDSTTFTEVDGVNDLGVRNWIATLPYLNVIRRHRPAEVSDVARGINEIIHHDGHRHDYTLTSATIEGIIRSVVNTPDDRTRFPGPSDPPIDTFGHISTSAPPNDTTEFANEFATTIVNREGVYWYQVTGATRTLYRLTVASIGIDEPSMTLPNGTLWLDLTPSQEVLRIKQTDPNTGVTDWVPVSGLSAGTNPIRLHNGTNPADITTATVSAWQKVDLNELLRETILEVETRLYENAPDPYELNYDFEQLSTSYPQLYESLLEQAFLAYTNQNEIIAPFANDDYTYADQFTWNYRYSSPGQSYSIIEASSATNTFKVEGDVTTSFGLDVHFHIKNSGVNDGFWTTSATIPTTYDGTHSTIYVAGRTVTDTLHGIIYTGILPSPWNPISRPYNLNDGSESGGDWRDLYQKLYGTPYPHLEPWVLQGYTDKPTWWDEEYLNDDPLKWGNRRWKYKHGFEVVGASGVDNYFEVAGEFCELFTTGYEFLIDQSTSSVHDGTWMVGSFSSVASVTTGVAGTALVTLSGDQTSTFVTGVKFVVTDSSGNLKALFTTASSIYTGLSINTTIILVDEAITDATNFDLISGTTYDPATNKSRIRIDTTGTPGASVVSNDVSGRIIPLSNGITPVGYGMWENIRTGIIPASREYPNGVVSVTGVPTTDIALYSLPIHDLPTFSYFSVNIGNDTITTGGTFNSDDILPPYWDYISHFGTSLPATIDRTIRSVYTLYTEIVSPGANYIFGDAGPVEWVWRNSSWFTYDLMAVAFQLDPVRFIFDTVGPEFYTIGGLFIDKRTNQVLSHTNTVFHGDIIDSSQIKFAGTNQWYVNFARYIGLDLSMSDFRSQWTLWETPMTYQFASFVDTPSLDVAHRTVCISNFDYNITSKRSPGVEDFWLDSFQAVVLSMPPKIVRYDNDYDWEIELRTKSTVGKTIKYYDVHNYQFSVDTATDTCSIYTWSITGVDTNNRTFTVPSDQTYLFTTDRIFAVEGSTANDGTYTVVSSAYNVISNETIVTVNDDIPDFHVDGKIRAKYRTLPWQTGDRVVLSTRETLPVPLQGDNSNGVYQYFVIAVDDYHFKLATTRESALQGNYVDITSVGRGDHFVGQVATTFNTTKTSKNWRHYVVDTRTLLEFTPPHDVRGLQTIVNIIDGYEAYTTEQGWRVNSSNTLKDFDNSSRFVGWQVETERFIDYVQTLRDVRQQVPQKYEATIDVSTDVWTIVDGSRPQFITGDPITVYVSGNLYPSPLARGIRYYMIRDSLTTFRLAATKGDAEAGVAIDITSVAGVDKIYIAAGSNLMKNRPTFEINPFRNGIWFRPEFGVVSNMLTGPTPDVFNTQLLLDQYSRALGQNMIRISRQDKETSISIANDITNDVELTSIFNDPYNYIHLAAIHLFIDAYEHVLIFNNKTTEGDFLYDPFIGLNVTKFEMLFNRQPEFTQRPNVGGQFLSTVYNQGADLTRNIEASIEDLRLLYDTYQVRETNALVETGRKSLGYEGRRDYLDNININAKSQFGFWRGQIQNKGSLNSVAAFINSRRFIDAKVDEFWAVKIAEFGSAQEKEYISMWLSTTDTANDLRLEFIPGDSISSVESGFLPISLNELDRWYDQPDQLELLRNNGGTLYFELKPTTMIPISISSIGSPSAPSNPNNGDGWINTSGTTYTFSRWDETTSSWVENGSWNSVTGPVYLRHNTKSDFLSITVDMYEDGHTDQSLVPTGSPMVIDIDPYIVGANNIRVFANGVQLTNGVEYEEVDTGNIFSSQVQLNLSGSPVGLVDVVYKTATLVDGVHFTRITTNIVKMMYPELFVGVGSPSITPISIKVWGWNADVASLNPAKVIDTKSETVVSPVQIWDPARGTHYYNGIHIVDLQRDDDPAVYNNTPRTNTNMRYWNVTEAGTAWLDTSRLGYVPYYDKGVFSNTNDRLRLWGKMADWSSMKIFTWVESDVPPDQWNALAIQEEGNASIPETQRKSGRIYQSLFEKNGSGDWVRLKDKRDFFDPTIEGIGAGTNTFVLKTIPAVNADIISMSSTGSPAVGTVIVAGDYSRRLSSGMQFYVGGTASSPNNDGVYVVDTVTSDGINTTITTASSFVTSGATGQIAFYQPVNVYVDGQLHEQDAQIVPTSLTSGEVTISALALTDRVCVELPAPTNETFIAAEVAAGSLLQAYEYTTDTYYDNLGIERTHYYFWVEDKATRNGQSMTPVEAQNQLVEIPIPYVFFQGVKDHQDVVFGGNTYTLPVRFTQAVVHGLRGVVSADFRYVLRWTRDFTLRDTLATGTSALQKKSLYEQWELLRRAQLTTIPRWLWNKVTESIVGYKLTDSSIRVPTYERELYDTKNGTDTQYGIGEGQALVSGELALATILADLNNPNNDFTPVDINVFFQNHSFDTPEEIVVSMDAIYNTFPYIHVNRMFFDVLLDGLSLVGKYEGIFKTSMIALHGIRPFQVGGLFDD